MQVEINKEGNVSMRLTTYERNVVLRALAQYENAMVHAADIEASTWPDGGHVREFRARAETSMELYRQLNNR